MRSYVPSTRTRWILAACFLAACGGNSVIDATGATTGAGGTGTASTDAGGPADCPDGGCNTSCFIGADCTLGCQGGGCSVGCFGATTCSLDCQGGGCTLQCGSSACSMDCPGGDCTMTGCDSAQCSLTCPPGQPQHACPGGGIACGACRDVDAGP